MPGARKGRTLGPEKMGPEARILHFSCPQRLRKPGRTMFAAVHIYRQIKVLEFDLIERGPCRVERVGVYTARDHEAIRIVWGTPGIEAQL